MPQDLDSEQNTSTPSLILLGDDSATPQAQPLRATGFTAPQPDDPLLTAQSFSRVPFADLPLYMPNLTSPVVGYDGGLNRAALQVSPQGVLCILLAYLDQSEGDFIELFLNGIRTDFHTVSDDEALNGKPINLYVESSRFIQEAGNPLQAVVTRIGGGTDRTKLFNIYVDVETPGGRNPVASTSENENLPLPIFPPDIVDFGVDQEAANNGVPVIIGHYPLNPALPAVNGRKVRDLIRLSIGGVIIEHRVTEFEASGRDPITITVYAGTWAQVGSGVHVCEWNVIDEVGNWSDGYSPAQLLEVRLNDGAEPLLPTAYILESTERPGNSDLLDVDALNGEDATFGVDVNRLGYVLGDIIRVRIAGRTIDGVAVNYVYNHPIDSTTRTQNISWPNADILPLINGRILLTYQRIRAGVPARNSEGNQVELTGTPVDTGLEAPQVPDAPLGYLPATTNPVNVIIKAYTGQTPNDMVTLVLEGTYANGRPYYREYDARAGSSNRDVIIEVPNGPNGDIRQLEGGTLRLYYKINGASERPISRSLTIQIGGIRAVLPAPESDQVAPPDYLFDPEVEAGSLNITVRSSLAFTLNSTVYLHFEGSAIGGSAPPQAFPITQTWVGRNLPFTVLRAFVITNLNGSARCYYTVERPGQATLTSEELVIRVGSALNLPVPAVLEGTVINPTLTRLNPLHVVPPRPEIVTIRVRYAPMLSTDDIKVHIRGKPGLGMPDIPSKPAIPTPGTDYVDFPVSSRFVAAYLGENSEVSYEVIRAGKPEPSAKLTLQVEALPAQELDLVTIPEAVGGEVDTSKTYNVQVEGWPFMRQGQQVWIDLLSSSNLALRIGTVVSTAEFSARRIRMPIPASYLRDLKDGDVLEVQVLVSLDGTGDKSSATPLTLSPAYSIKRASGVVEGVIMVGNIPNHLALSSDNSTLYVANFGSKTVSVIDTFTRKVVHTITLTAAPRGIAIHPNGRTLYVSIELSTTLAIETENFQTIATVGGFNYVSALHLNPTGSRLYAGNDFYGYIQEIDTSTNTSVKYLYAYQYYTQAVTTNRSGSRIYSTGYYISTFNQSNGELLGYYSNGSTESRGIAYSPDAEIIYATTYGTTPTNGTLNVMSAATTPVALIRKIESLSQPWGIAFLPQGGKAYMCLYGDNSIKIIDTSTHTVTGEINTQNFPLDRPKEIVISSDGSQAYVANSGNNNVIIINL